MPGDEQGRFEAVLDVNGHFETSEADPERLLEGLVWKTTFPAPGRPGTQRVKVNGVDVFKPQTGEVISNGADGIACWFIDTDYNEESFFVPVSSARMIPTAP
jgi:hypothetical protein